jgi:hypothetical protein
MHCQMRAMGSGSTQSNTATRLIAHASASTRRNRRFFAKHCLLARRWTNMAPLLRPADGGDVLGRECCHRLDAVVTGLEWVRDAERCWCGATCPLRRRHTCRPRWWALLYQRPHLSCSSSPPVPSPSPPMTMATCMRTAPSCSRAAGGGQLEQWPQLCCVRMSALQWRQGCVGVALC